jgi:hypothetical protein
MVALKAGAGGIRPSIDFWSVSGPSAGKVATFSGGYEKGSLREPFFVGLSSFSATKNGASGCQMARGEPFL